MFSKIIMAIMLCGHCMHATAQSLRQLNIGDYIPSTSFKYTIQGNEAEATLPNPKYNLTILDFWATWCSSCIKTLPKIDSLQQKFQDRLQFILVNTVHSGDSNDKIQSFKDRWQSRNGKALPLKSIEQDSVLYSLFPHELLPHYVWIDGTGKVIAFTSATEINEPTIRAVLEGVPVSFAQKKEQSRERPIFTNEDLPKDSLHYFGLLTKGRFDGLGSGNRMQYKDTILHGRAITNTSLYDIYQTITRELYGLPKNRIFFAQDISKEVNEHIYTMEVILPVNSANKLYENMLQVINENGQFIGKLETQEIDCLVLTGTPTITGLIKGDIDIKLMNERNPYLKNAPIKYLVDKFNHIPAISLPVIDETKHLSPIDMSFPEGFEDLESIKKRLKHYGLQLTQGRRVLSVFVIQKKNN